MSGKVLTNIVTDSLVLYLDAANTRSYPGSGTTWYDLSDNGSDFTLANNPTYDGTSLDFNGTNQYALANSVSTGNFGSNEFTIEFVANVTNHDLYATVLSKRTYDAANGFYAPFGGGWNFRAGPTTDGGPSVISTGTPEVRTNSQVTPSYNTLYYSCTTINRSGTLITINAYINGVLKQTISGNISSTTIDNSGINMRIMAGRQGSTLYYTTGKMYVVRLYNKALSSTEITQNYNALKNRFGL